MDPQVPDPERVVSAEQSRGIEPRVEGQKPTDNHWISILAMAIFVIFSLGVVAFLYYQNQQLKAMIAGYQQPHVSPYPIVTPDPTTSWKTFSNTKSGVQFKYPQEWYAKQMIGWTLNVFLDDHDFVIPTATEFITPIQVSFNEVMNTNTNVKSYSEKTVEDAVKRFKTDVFGKDVTETDNLTVGGNKAIQLAGTAGPGMLEGQYFKITYVQMDNKVLIVSLNTNKNYETIYDQILSTFKFTGATSSAKPTPTSKACTQEAKVCPDGSSVGRTGPNCEFAPCP